MKSVAMIPAPCPSSLFKWKIRPSAQGLAVGLIFTSPATGKCGRPASSVRSALEFRQSKNNMSMRKDEDIFISKLHVYVLSCDAVCQCNIVCDNIRSHCALATQLNLYCSYIRRPSNASIRFPPSHQTSSKSCRWSRVARGGGGRAV
eukprot:COSAG01_NODE_410_length_17384_cov_20.323691_8_plen_147_part_00